MDWIYNIPHEYITGAELLDEEYGKEWVFHDTYVEHFEYDREKATIKLVIDSVSLLFTGVLKFDNDMSDIGADLVTGAWYELIPNCFGRGITAVCVSFDGGCGLIIYAQHITVKSVM